MKKDKLIQVRLDEKLKKDSEAVFKKLSINRSAAINLFLRQVVIKQEIPFKIKSKKDAMNNNGN